MKKPKTGAPDNMIQTFRQTNLHISTDCGQVFDPGNCNRYFKTCDAGLASKNFGNLESNIEGIYVSGNIHVSPRKLK